MKCISLYDKNYTPQKSNNVLLKKGGYVDIKITAEHFSGGVIQGLLGKIYYVISTYGRACKQINIRFRKFWPNDKLTYILLECMIYSLMYECGYTVKIYMGFIQTDIRTIGFRTSALYNYMLSKFNKNEEFGRKFKNEQLHGHFRRVVSAEDTKGEKIGLLLGEIKTFFKVFELKKEYIEQAAVVVTELIDNCGDHTEADCLVDIDVSDPVHKVGDVEANSYYGVNIVVLNFSEKLIGTDITEKIKAHYFSNGDRYEYVERAYNNHKRYFNEGEYDEEDFFNITSFQDKISGRKNEINSGGTGLTQLINSLEKNADEHACYVMSGNKGIIFNPKFLEYNNEKWIGFNNEKDYLDHIPDRSIIKRSDTYFPGTAYNFTLIYKKEKEMEKNIIELKFGKLVTNLAGNRFGRETFQENIADKFDDGKENIIVIPERIEDVATSFIQGIYSKTTEKYGKEKALDIMKLKAKNKETMDKILFSIEVYGI